jgi:hypothetical protein
MRASRLKTGRIRVEKQFIKRFNATLNIQKQYFTAGPRWMCILLNLPHEEILLTIAIQTTYHWQEEVATYSGDIRALSNMTLPW